VVSIYLGAISIVAFLRRGALNPRTDLMDSRPDRIPIILLPSISVRTLLEKRRRLTGSMAATMAS
jgi:hypothetical protein